MYINPATGKGWTDEEELAFSAIMERDAAPRIAAIQKYRRLHPTPASSYALTAPDAESPVGLLMDKVFKKFPNITFEDARAKANELLSLAAGRNNYSIPPVQTGIERAVSALKVKKSFAKGNWTPEEETKLGQLISEASEERLANESAVEVSAAVTDELTDKNDLCSVVETQDLENPVLSVYHQRLTLPCECQKWTQPP